MKYYEFCTKCGKGNDIPLPWMKLNNESYCFDCIQEPLVKQLNSYAASSPEAEQEVFDTLDECLKLIEEEKENGTE